MLPQLQEDDLNKDWRKKKTEMLRSFKVPMYNKTEEILIIVLTSESCSANSEEVDCGRQSPVRLPNS